jgi:hypothetical protein
VIGDKPVEENMRTLPCTTRACLIALSAIPLVCQAAAQTRADAGSARTIIVAQENQRYSPVALLIDVIRTRLPLKVAVGRFGSEGGVTDVCISSPRGQRLPVFTPRNSDPRWPTCNSIPVFLNGTRLVNAGSYLLNARLDEFEIVALLSEAAALARYGISAAGGDVLVLWRTGMSPRSWF